MSNTRPAGTTHDPDAVERVARAIYDSRDERVRHTGEAPLPWAEMPAFVQDAYRADAIAALGAINALYDDEEDTAMSDTIERYTDIVLNCLTNAPNARAGARLAVYRLADEMRKALREHIGVDSFANELFYVLEMTPRGPDRAKMFTHIMNVAWDTALGDDDEGGARP